MIGSDNGLSPGRLQATIWTNAVNITLRNTIQWNIYHSYIFTYETAFEKVVWKIAAILSQPQCVFQYNEENGFQSSQFLYQEFLWALP